MAILVVGGAGYIGSHTALMLKERGYDVAIYDSLELGHREAVEIVAVPPEQDNHVVAEFQPGYKYGEKLLRPARVRVGRASS